MTFDPDDGNAKTTAITDISVKLTLAELPTLTRDGYTFDGWFTARNGGTAVTIGHIFDAHTTIFAHWP